MKTPTHPTSRVTMFLPQDHRSRAPPKEEKKNPPQAGSFSVPRVRFELTTKGL